MRKIAIASVAILVLAAVTLVALRPQGAVADDPGQRVVTLMYDPLTSQVLADFETTLEGDTFVSVSGLAVFPGGGSQLWGTHPIGPDPTGATGHSTTYDPSGTTYSLVVQFFDAQQNLVATFAPPPVVKP